MTVHTSVGVDSPWADQSSHSKGGWPPSLYLPRSLTQVWGIPPASLPVVRSSSPSRLTASMLACSASQSSASSTFRLVLDAPAMPQGANPSRPGSGKSNRAGSSRAPRRSSCSLSANARRMRAMASTALTARASAAGLSSPRSRATAMPEPRASP